MMEGGLAAFAFWGFVAVITVANVWREVVMRRESETTIRMAIEKGQQLDPATIDKLLRSNRRWSSSRRGGADGLMVAGGLTLATGLGLPVLGYFISRGGDIASRCIECGPRAGAAGGRAGQWQNHLPARACVGLRRTRHRRSRRS